jgi:hypothetical protein
MYYTFEEVPVTDELSELRLVENAGRAPEQHIRFALSQKLAKRLGFDYRALPELDEASAKTYYLLTSGEQEQAKVLIRNAVDDDPEAVVIGGWEPYLDNGLGEIGPYAFAVIDAWRDKVVDASISQVTKEEFTLQADLPFAMYQAPREVTKQMSIDYRDFSSSRQDSLIEKINKDLHDL